MKLFPLSILAIFLLAFIWGLLDNCSGPDFTTLRGETAIKVYYTNNLDSTISRLEDLKSKVFEGQTEKELQNLFFQSRLWYKKSEAITEYYFQGLSKRINGPVLPDIKTEDGQVFPPHGFQVIEEILFSGNPLPKGILINEIAVLCNDLRYIKKQMTEISISDFHFYDLVQHQIIRIATQGIVGLDAPLSKYSIHEASAALEGLEDISKAYMEEDYPKYYSLLQKAKSYAQKKPEFDSFDRLHFIVSLLAPLSVSFEESFKGPKNLDAPKASKLVRGNLSDLVAGRNLDPDYFSPYKVSHSNKEKVNLGKLLFNEKALSKNKTLSCASCHNPTLAFTDGKKKASNFIHGGSLMRNTPTLYYSGLQNSQFYDMRSIYLEDQVADVMKNTNEFGLNEADALDRVLKMKKYPPLFRQAFPEMDSINSYMIRNAISTYIRSLNPFNSPFDHYLRGNLSAISIEAVKGFNLFSGKAKCATCHFIPFFNGTVPPWYNKTESEVIGVPTYFPATNSQIDPDPGRYAINQIDELKFAFKTPTVRNIALTAPYMHNGAINSLEDVVEFYHLGGGKGIGIKLSNQSLPFDNLLLDEAEKKAIATFLRTLTDEPASIEENKKSR